VHVSLKVKDVMRTRNLVSVRREDDVAMAAQLMGWAGVRHLPVIDGREADGDPSAGRVVGVFTERDLLR
jgi:CBS domain-containing protein